jgi:phosphotriesterase-related protein
MLSHDVDMDLSLVYFGGTGFGYLADVFLPKLREQGVSEETITQLTVDNPRRWLTMAT